MNYAEWMREMRAKRDRFPGGEVPFGTAAEVYGRRAWDAALEHSGMRLALERARGCIKGLLARTPVRDVQETLAEIDAALSECHSTGGAPK